MKGRERRRPEEKTKKVRERVSTGNPATWKRMTEWRSSICMHIFDTIF